MLAKRVCASLAAFMIAAGATIVPFGEGFQSTLLPQLMIVEAAENNTFYYNSPDTFVADCLLGNALLPGDVRYPPISGGFANEAVQTDFVYKELGYGISQNGVAYGTALYWQNLRKSLKGDFADMANWEEIMYEVLIMDYLAYDGKMPEHESDFMNLSAELGKEIGEAFIDYGIDELDSLPTEDYWKYAKDIALAYDCEEAYDLVFGDAGFTDSTMTCMECIDKMSKAIAIKKANKDRVAFLKAMRNHSFDDHFTKACDMVINIFEMPDICSAAYAYRDSTTECLSELVVHEAWKEFLEKADDIPGVGEALAILKIGTAGTNWLFNNDDTSEATLQEMLIYIMGVTSRLAYDDIMYDYMNSRAEYASTSGVYVGNDADKARAFINAYEQYINFQTYGNTIADTYFYEKLSDGLGNYLTDFMTHNQDTYQIWHETIQGQADRASTWLSVMDTYRSFYNELSNNESKTDDTPDNNDDDNNEDIHIEDPVIPSETFKVDDSGMSNEYLRLISYPNGWFRLNTTEGDPALSSDNDKLLLYHGDTSYSTIVIDGAVNKFGEAGIEEPVYDFGNESQTIVATYGDITVKQILTFANNASTNRCDVLEIKYEVTNNGTESHKIGTRIMLDTMLGDNDDAPFRVPGTGNLTTEKEYSGSSIPQYWQAFDSLTNPTVISQGSFLRGNENQPDKVQFTNWRRVTDTPWNYEVSEGSSNGDSAVSVIWNEKELAAGETRTYSTYYGLSELTQDVAPPLALSMYCDSTANYDSTTGNYMPVDVTAYIENIGNGDAKNAYLRIELPDEMELADSEEGSNEGVDVEFFDNLYVGNIESRTWKIKMLNSIKPNTTYPITIVCGADGVEEKKVTRYITIPKATITPKDNRIDWGNDNGTGKFPGVDNLAFTNSPYNFFDENVGYTTNSDGTLDQIKGKYTLDKPVFNFLTDGMSNTVWKNMYDYQNSTWGGSCYGMSTVVSLMKAGYLTPDKWTTSATNAHGLDKPKDNHMTMSLINFYQTSFQLPDLQDIYYNYVVTHTNDDGSTDQRALLKNLIDNTYSVAEGGLPVNVCYSWKTQEDGKTKTHGHSVIAYEVALCGANENAPDGKHYKYKVSICDPNELNHWTYMYVSEDYSSWTYENFATTASGSDDGIIANSWEINCVLSDVGSLDIKNPETREDRTIMKNYNRNFIRDIVGSTASISSADGKSSRISNGNITGDLPIYVLADFGDTVEGNTPDTETIFLPEGNETPYTITPEDGMIDSTITFENNMFSVYATDAKSATYDPAGTVSVDLSNSSYMLNATFNEGHGDLPWFTVSAEGKSSNTASLTIATEGMVLSSDNLKDTNITANNREDEVTVSFSTDKTSVLLNDIDAETLGVFIDADGNGTYETLIADSKNTDYSTPSDDSSNTDSSNSNDDSSKPSSSDTDNSSTNDDSSSDNSHGSDSSSSSDDSSNSSSSNSSNSSSSNTPSNSDSGSTTSQNNTSTNSVIKNTGSTDNPKTGNAGTATKAFGLAALMLGITTVLKKKKQ